MPRVLVVAAQPAVQAQLGNLLRADGHAVLVAADAQEGLRRWSADGPDLIALDDELPGTSGVELVASLRRSEPPGTHTPVVLIGRSSDIDAKLAAIRAGADDYVDKPIHVQELSARVLALLARFPHSDARVATPPRRRSGRVFAFYGAKGGVGTTTLAINTAIALHRDLKGTVALVDANLQFGDHRVFLDLTPDQRSIVDAVTAPAMDLDLVRQVMVWHDSGIELLLAPPSPASAELVSRDDHHLLRVIELLRQSYDYVVVDMDQALDDHMLDVIGAADRLALVMTADLSCLKNVRLVLDTMAQLAVPDDRLMLVLNRADAFTGISARSVEGVLKRPIAQQIANDYRSAIAALNSGTPFVTSRPRSALARAVTDLARVMDRQAPPVTTEWRVPELALAR